MSPPKSETRYTVEEYLAMERESEERHEYLDGIVYAMAGESPEHGEICMNLSRIISAQLMGKPCRARSKDSKVRNGPIPKTCHTTKGLYSYPDLLVVCGEPEFHDKYRDVLLNPKVIIEVLSPTTEAFDRGEKFLRYRTFVESLTDYLVVVQSRSLIEHFARQPNGQWVIAATATEISRSVELTSIDCVLGLSKVYDRIVFPAPTDEEADPTDN